MAKLFDKLADLVSDADPPELDPTKFNDPLAERIDWTPIQRSGANYRSHKLATDAGPDCIEFTVTPFPRLVILAIRTLGACFLVTAAYMLIQGGGSAGPGIMGIGGVMFLGGGSLIHYKWVAKRLIFDRAAGYYWIGRKGSLPPAGPRPPADGRPGSTGSVKLDEIHAIQIIDEYVSGENSSYYSYELNLVLTDGHRIGVIDHKNADWLTTDARTLADFLSIPIWNAVSTYN